MAENKKKQILYFGGVPTDIEVKKLIDTYGTPDPGTLIPYDEIETCINVSRAQNRFKTVTTAWRRRMQREHNIIFEAQKNEGFLALTAGDRVKYSVKKFKSGIRSISNAASVAAATDRNGLTPEQIRTCDHMQNRGAQIRMTERIEARKIGPADKNTEQNTNEKRDK